MLSSWTRGYACSRDCGWADRYDRNGDICPACGEDVEIARIRWSEGDLKSGILGLLGDRENGTWEVMDDKVADDSACEYCRMEPCGCGRHLPAPA